MVSNGQLSMFESDTSAAVLPLPNTSTTVFTTKGCTGFRGYMACTITMVSR